MLGLLLGAGLSAGAAYLQSQQRQKENKENLGMQTQANKELAKYSSDLQYNMWQKTGYEAQRKQMEEAGLNPALMYGQGGGGGQTTGSASAGSASQGQAGNYDIIGGMQLGLMDAQKKNIEAQTEASKAEAAKKEAEAEKLKGIDTEKATQEARATKFQNDLNELIGQTKMADNYGWAADKVETESQRANAEWEAYQAAGFKGRSFDDPNSPVAKALKAGWEKTVTDLENAKKEGNIKEAETVIKNFQAELAKQGIDPNAPWYIKFVGDLLNKVGVKLF